MTKKHISPSVQLQSFNCPHCGALAHQYWYRLYARESHSNKLDIWYPSRYEQRVKEESKKNRDKLSKESMDVIRKKSEGKVFFTPDPYKPYRNTGCTIPDISTSYTLHNVFISECHSCKELSLWMHDKLIYPPEPEAEEANPDMPDDIRKDYEEARIVFKYSPRCAAALLRLCIEKLCIHLGSKKEDNLNKKIAYLVQKGLNKELQEALDTIRIFGNESVHAGQIDVSDNKDIARTLFKFVNYIVEDLITKPKQIGEIFESLPNGKKEAIKKRDKIDKNLT